MSLVENILRVGASVEKNVLVAPYAMQKHYAIDAKSTRKIQIQVPYCYTFRRNRIQLPQVVGSRDAYSEKIF